MVLLEREDALNAAFARIGAARQGQGGILVVAGEAGIGKSALIRHALAKLDRGSRVLLGGCEDLFSPRPLGALRDIALAVRGKLLETLDAGASADVVFSSFFELLSDSAVSTVVVFEDVHWADAATLDLIKYLARRIGRLPAMLVLSYRDDEVCPDHALLQVLGDLPPAHLTRVALRPLSETAVAQLAASAGRPHHGLHMATGGNPFYVTEVLACGLAAAQQGVPSTVRDAVHTRLARLSVEQREVLRALCVVPGQIEPWLVRSLLGPSGVETVDDCIGRGVLIELGNALAFRHELARRATVDTLAPMQRQERHARVLKELMAPPPGVALPPLSRLVHHAAEARDAARVLELAPLAAREAAAVGAHREAALQFAAALRFAESAPVALRAQLHESWSYEAGLSMAINATVIDARHQAIALWRRLGRLDKVGHNLRWLSRLHWYEGDGARAERYAEEAVTTLEPLPPGPELAWAYSVRSQLYMLQDRTDLAVRWGERAIRLAEQLGESEILCHALNNVGTAELFADRLGGTLKLERSLALALEGGFHEQAARVYTNASEHAVVFKDYRCAERWLLEGIEFDRQHDLDSWTHYLVGWLAQLRLEQGQLDDAERIAREILEIPGLTAVMRLPALTVLARVRMRRAEVDTDSLLEAALAIALPTGEMQRIVPVVTAMAEARWLRGEQAGCLAALRLLEEQPGAGVNPWEAGEIAAWRRRAGDAKAPVPQHSARPWLLELQGNPQAAADAWLELGAPNEAGLALLHAALAGTRDQASSLLQRAHLALDTIGARLATARTRAIAREWGLHGALPGRRRGPYAAAREHPCGLSAREQQVLGLLALGSSNDDIALRIGVARRTVEHHVSAVLSKLGVGGRTQAVAKAQKEGLLPPSSGRITGVSSMKSESSRAPSVSRQRRPGPA